jgi:hypothetical protein
MILNIISSLFVVCSLAIASEDVRTISAVETIEKFYEDNICRHENIQLGTQFSAACITTKCGRQVVDGIFSDEDITKLHDIVEKGMATRELLGGPTILDINTGYIRDSKGLENLFTKNSVVYTDNDFAHYGRIIKKLKESVAAAFEIEDIYFTAPTFITRLDGTKVWEPQGCSITFLVLVIHSSM